VVTAIPREEVPAALTLPAAHTEPRFEEMSVNLRAGTDRKRGRRFSREIVNENRSPRSRDPSGRACENCGKWRQNESE
jgi:hypothetical protein